ncbi:hypothetical protein BDV93DRAFT_509786 [Ceratobasidium sp. AG-I]|nr:hypothetical protein BDV93DRAFT_509786 [Ceratobasidium sp. AG-I]
MSGSPGTSGEPEPSPPRVLGTRRRRTGKASTPATIALAPSHDAEISTVTEPIASSSNPSQSTAQAGRSAASTSLDKFHNVMQHFGSKKGITLGGFMQTLLDPSTELSRSETAMLSSWLKGQTEPGTRPVEITDAIYCHKFSRTFEGGKLRHGSFVGLGPPTHSPKYLDKYPHHATLLPPASGIDELYNGREGLEELFSRGTLAIVDREADLLCEPGDAGLPRGQGVTWSIFEAFSLFNEKEKIKRLAPVTWSILSTMTFSRSRDTLPASISNAPAITADASTAVSTLGQTPNDPDTVIEESTGALPTDTDKEHNRNPELAILMAIFVLLFFRNQNVNLFQHIVGVFLFACNAPKTVFRALGRLGITSAHSTIYGILERLGLSAYETLVKMGKSAYESASDTTRPQEYFLLLFDNINKYARARKQTVAKKNEVKSGTAATAIVLEDVPPGAFNPQPYFSNLKKQERRNLTLSRLYEDIDLVHLRNAGIGGSNVLHDLTEQMKLEPSWLESMLIMVCGDWLSIDRLRKAIQYKAKDSNVYEQQRWALPIIQLWHMKWAFLKVICKTHWSDSTGPDISVNLRHGFEALNRKFNHEKCDFYPGHEGLKTVFDSLVLTCVLTVARGTSQADSISGDTHTHMLSTLRSLFASGGQFESCTLSELENLAGCVYDRYFTTGAYLEAVSMKDSSFTQPQMTELLSSIMGQLGSRRRQPDTAQTEEGATSTAEQEQEQEESEQSGSGGSSSIEPMDDINTSTTIPTAKLGDAALSNAILLIRDGFWYMEFATAVTEGDIGRVFEIIKVLRFTFWGGGATNYGNELLELACNYYYEYPAELQVAIFNNYLVNPSGLKNHWHELDLLQEHFNLWIKCVFNKKNSGFDSDFMRSSVSVNVTGFGRHRDSFMRMLGLSRTSSGRSFPEYEHDIDILATHYQQSAVLSFQAGRTQGFTAKDTFSLGYEELESGTLAKFLQRTSQDPEQIQDEPEDGIEVVDLEFPPEPLVLENGVLIQGVAPEFSGLNNM